MSGTAGSAGDQANDVIPIVCGDGARAELHRNGAHLTSWVPAGARADRLFVSRTSAFGTGASIRGGVPVVFPQFAAEGPLPKHGFARTMPWTLMQVDENADFARVALELVDDNVTRAIWPYAFRAELSVQVEGSTLDVGLSIENRDRAPFSFTAALHTYFRLRDAFSAQIIGLDALRYRDKLADHAERDQCGESLAIVGEIDRVYYNAIAPLEIRDGDRRVRVEQRGFRDVVVWNPGENGLRGKADFAAGEEREMLCVEAAVVQNPIVLAPAERWSGSQIISAVR